MKCNRCLFLSVGKVSLYSLDIPVNFSRGVSDRELRSYLCIAYMRWQQANSSTVRELFFLRQPMNAANKARQATITVFAVLT